MKIKTRIYLSAVASILLVVLIFSLIFKASLIIEKEAKKDLIIDSRLQANLIADVLGEKILIGVTSQKINCLAVIVLPPLRPN